VGVSRTPEISVRPASLRNALTMSLSHSTARLRGLVGLSAASLAHGQRGFHHHACVAQHFFAGVAVQELVRDVARGAEPDHEHGEQHQVELQP
jgi:hypothetical protein